MTLKDLLNTFEKNEKIRVTTDTEIISGLDVYQFNLYKDSFLESFEVIDVYEISTFKIIHVKKI